MNKIIKILVESKFNFNIDIEDNKEMPRLSKQKYKSISQYDALIINAFKQHDLTILDYEQKKQLYNNLEEFRQYQYKVKNKEESKDLVKNADVNADLNLINTYNIVNMSHMFQNS